MAEIQVSVMSPAKVMSRTKAGQVQVTSSMGELGILPGHARLVAELGIGRLAVLGAEGGDGEFFVAGGYLEVADNVVTVLADVIERPKDIDRRRAEKARERAVARLEKATPETDIPRAQQALRRAEGRLGMSAAAK